MHACILILNKTLDRFKVKSTAVFSSQSRPVEDLVNHNVAAVPNLASAAGWLTISQLL